jgi:hypothetical protein
MPSEAKDGFGTQIAKSAVILIPFAATGQE